MRCDHNIHITPGEDNILLLEPRSSQCVRMAAADVFEKQYSKEDLVDQAFVHSM